MLNALLFIVAAASGGTAGINDAEIQGIADRYLKSLASGDQSGKAQLLGGATYDAKQAVVYNPKILSKAAPRTEEASLADLAAQMHDLDKVGFKFLGQETEEDDKGAPQATDLQQALKLVEQTRQARQAMLKKFPVFSDVIRVDRPLYWHPKNPMRPLIKQAGKKGTYHVDYISFSVQSQDDPKAAPRTWPLRIVRFKANDVDTGWKVLPASEWDPE